MEEKKVLTKKEALELAKFRQLDDEDLESVNGGTGELNWAWNAVYKIYTWPEKSQVQFIFNNGDRLKLWEFFGGGDDATVYNRVAEYSDEHGGWLDIYCVREDDGKCWRCKRDVIVYQD